MGWGWGVGNPFSLTRREELLPVITCAPELGLSQDCLGQDATFSPPAALQPWNRMIRVPMATSTTQWLVWSPPTQPW